MTDPARTLNPPSSNQSEQQRFEAWAARYGYSLDLATPTGDYLARDTFMAWHAWNARAELPDDVQACDSPMEPV